MPTTSKEVIKKLLADGWLLKKRYTYDVKN